MSTILIFTPNNLTLKLSFSDQNCVNYLDTHIQIEGGGVDTMVYDKKDSFKFDMIKILHFNSNVHNLIFRNVFFKWY